MIQKQIYRAVNQAETRGRVTFMLHDALALGVDVSLILKACGPGLRSWQNPFDDFQVMPPYGKGPAKTCTLQSIREIWIDSDMELRMQYEAALSQAVLGKDDQDDADWDLARG